MKPILCRSGVILFLLFLFFITRSKTSISQKIAFISSQLHSFEKGREKNKIAKRFAKLYEEYV